MSAFSRRARAFVLGLGHSGLAAVRGLGEVGVPVTGVDWQRESPGLKSRYCRTILCPNPGAEPERLLERLLAAGREQDHPAVLLPTSDAFVLFMARYRAALSPHFLFALPSSDVVEATINKRLQYEMAERVGTACPQTFYPETADDVARIKHEVEYPAILKPYYSHLWSAIFRSKGLWVADAADLERRFDEVARHGQPMLVQSFIPGPYTNLYKTGTYLDADGRPLAMFTSRKLRQYPIDLGDGTFDVSVRVPALRDFVLQFYRGIDYRGIGDIQAKWDPRDGRFKLIELNPRLWGQNIHATRCGVNFPLIAYLDLTGQHPAPRADYREGVYWLDLTPDFQVFWTLYRRGELSPQGWISSIAKARAFAYFDWRDPLPFLAHHEYGRKWARLPRYLLRHPRGRPSLAR